MRGVISANINFQILLCHSPMLLFSFLRNSYMHGRVLLFPFEFCYLLFWFYYAIMHSFIQFRILLFAFELCYAVVQFYDSIVQSSHAVSNPIISFPILLFTFPILFVFQFPILLFAFELCSSKSGTCIVYLAYGALGTSKEFSRDIANHSGLGRGRFTESITSMHKCNSTAT